MSIEENKIIMDRFVEFINSADEKLGRALISSSAKFYVPGRIEPLEGPSGYLQIIGMMRNGFPDIKWQLDEVVAEDDRLAARFTMRGTHRGTFLGVPPTDKSIVVKAMNFYRLSNGQLVEEYGMPDMMGLMQQIGALPA
jgi:steroid delta-isomerase-like uncharacterized protein